MQQAIKDTKPVDHSRVVDKVPEETKGAGPRATKDTPLSGTVTDRTNKSNTSQISDYMA